MAALFVRKTSWINSRLQWFFIVPEKIVNIIHWSQLRKTVYTYIYPKEHCTKLYANHITVTSIFLNWVYILYSNNKKTNWVLNSYFHCNLHTKKLVKSKVRSLPLNYPLSFQSLHCELPFKRYPSNFHFPFWTHIFCKEWK